MENLMLTIDLSNRSYEIEEIPQEIIRKYIGGRGLGAYLLYRSVPAKADPLGPENHLIFTAGPANGTDFFFSSKANVNTKSPLTGIYLYSISSGILAHQMRKAGFWALDIKGIAEAPTYLQIENREVRFKDAAALWGMETAKAQQAILEGRSAKTAATVGIGPGGEKLIKYAGLFCDGILYRCFGRGGAGAVMGSKKLKGLMIAGSGDVPIADPAGLESIKKEIAHRLRTDFKEWADRWRRYETGSGLDTLNATGILPTRNWQTGQFEGWRGIDKSTTPMGWPEQGARPCGPFCPTPGCREVAVTEGPYKGARADIEYETIYAFGAICGVDKMEPVIAAGQICDEAGLDTMSAGMSIGFAMECYEKGLIDKTVTDGIDLRFGNHEAMIKMLRKITLLEGFGKQLAEGTKRLSGQIKGSEDFAIHAKGLELGGYECRGLNGQALQFAVDNRGGCHKGYGLTARQEIVDNTRLNIAGKGALAKNTGIAQMLIDSTPACSFSSRLLNPAVLRGVLNAITGETRTKEDLEAFGCRVMCQERLFNMREGISRADDTLPARLLKEPKPDGPAKGSVVPLDALLDEYYRTMGYDVTTGNPPDSLLEKLGVEK